MTRLFGRWILIVLSFASVAAVPSASEASLLNWLFPGRAARQAQRWAAYNAYRPVTTSYYGGYAAGGTNFGSGAYYPAYGQWNGWNRTPTIAQYRPTTAYRTIWAPVPVTSFRPTMGGNQQQVCNSYSWQTRRVPYVAFQPTLLPSPLAPDCACSIPSAPSCHICESPICESPICEAPSCEAPSCGCHTTVQSPVVSACRPVCSIPSAPGGHSCEAPSCGCPTTVRSPVVSAWRPVCPTPVCPTPVCPTPVCPIHHVSVSECGCSTGSNWQGPTSTTPADNQPTLGPLQMRNYGSTPRSSDVGATPWRPLTAAEPANQSIPGASGSGEFGSVGDSSEWRPFSRQRANDPLAQYSHRDDRRGYRIDDHRDHARSEFYRGKSGSNDSPESRHGLEEEDRERQNQFVKNDRRRQVELDGRDGRDWRSADDWSRKSTHSHSGSGHGNEETDHRERQADGWKYQASSHPSYDWRSDESYEEGERTAENVNRARDLLPITRSQQPLLLQPIPDSHREARAGQRPTRTAALASFDRWEAIPVARTPRTVAREERMRPRELDSQYEGWQTKSN